MSAEERTGQRSLAYSSWHREKVIQEYVGEWWAKRLPMIDIDAAEYCSWCHRVVAWIETAFDVGQPKGTYVLRGVSRDHGAPAYLVYYRQDDRERVAGFRIRRIAPDWGPELLWTPQEWAEELVRIRERHLPTCVGVLGVAVKAEIERRLL